MTRRATAATALALALAAAAPGAAFGQTARPDLVVQGAAEPPSVRQPGENWIPSLTVQNQGRRTARGNALRGYLSPDQEQDATDRPLDGTAAVPRLRRGRQKTLRVTFTVPAGTPNGTYFVILCVDDAKVVTESTEDDNCRPSGQRLGVGASEKGPIGPPGPPGEPGPAGPDAFGPESNFRPIVRTSLRLGSPTVDLAAFPLANGKRPNGTATPDEGSTSTKSLVKYGPFDIVASCKTVTNGDGQPPSQPPGGGGFDEDGDEAKVLVYVDSGSYTMQGRHGPRKDIPAGAGTPADDGVNGGEGKHMALAVNHDPDPAADNDAQSNEEQWGSTYRHTDAFIIHSSGTQLILRVWAGIDVLGVGNDACAFGGVLEVVQP